MYMYHIKVKICDMLTLSISRVDIQVHLWLARCSLQVVGLNVLKDGPRGAQEKETEKTERGDVAQRKQGPVDSPGRKPAGAPDPKTSPGIRPGHHPESCSCLRVINSQCVSRPVFASCLAVSSSM